MSPNKIINRETIPLTPRTRREKEVWHACDELWQELQLAGESIASLTGEKLREKLFDLGYAKGNQNQLFEYRNTWKQSHGLKDLEILQDRKSILSQRVQDAVALVLKELYQEADAKVEEYENRFRIEKENLLEENKKLTMSFDEVQSKFQLIEGHYNDIKLQFEITSKQLQQSQHDLTLAKKNEITLKSELEDLKNLHVQHTQQLEENFDKSLSFFRDALQNSKSQYENDLKELKENHINQLQENAAEIDKWKNLYVQTQADKERIQIHLDQTNTELEKIQSQLQELQKNLNSEKTNKEQLQNNLINKETEHKQIVYQHEKLIAQLQTELTGTKEISEMYKLQWQQVSNENKNIRSTIETLREISTE